MSTPSVLLVDGDPKSLKLMEVGLRREGHEVIALGGAEAARAWPAGAPPTLIVAAADLPGEDGLDLLAELRGRAGWEDTPSLVLAPERTPEVVSRGMELGAEEFLTRPVFVRELLARVRMVLERRTRNDGNGAVVARSGPLSELELVDLLTALEAEQASGVVYLESEDRRGRLFLRDGRVVDAKVGATAGSDAALRVFRWHGGAWTFDPREVAQRDRIGQATTDLLAEAMERSHAWSDLWAKLPGSDPVLEVDFQGVATAGAKLPPDASKILRLFDGLRTASRVIEDSPFDELATLRAVVRMHEQGLLSAPAEAGSDPEAEAPTRELDAWLDDEDRTPTGAMAAAPTVVVISPEVAAAERAARSRAEEILREAEAARDAAERARKEAEAARATAEQARADAEAASVSAAQPAPAPAPQHAAAVADEADHDVDIERDPSDEIATEAPAEEFGSVVVEDDADKDPGHVLHEEEVEEEFGDGSMGDDEEVEEKTKSMLPALDTSLLDGAGPPPEEEDSWGDAEATIHPDAPPLDNPDAAAPAPTAAAADEEEDDDEGEEVRLDTSSIVEESSLEDAPPADAESSAAVGDGEAEADDGGEGDDNPWGDELAFGDSDDDDDEQDNATLEISEAAALAQIEAGLGDPDDEDVLGDPDDEEEVAEDPADADLWGDGDLEAALAEAADTAVDAEPISPAGTPLPDPADEADEPGEADADADAGGDTAGEDPPAQAGAFEPGAETVADMGVDRDALLGDSGGDSGEFDWAAELDSDGTVPSMTPPPSAADEVAAAKDEMEDFGWGESDDETDDDLDWGDALDGAGDPKDSAGQGGDTEADVDAFAADDELPPPAAPPTAVELPAVVPPGGSEADEWEQALAEGDEFYEDDAPPPLNDTGDGLDFDLSDDDATGDLDLGGDEEEEDDVDQGGGREDSGPIDLSKFASRKHNQVKEDSGTSVWLKVAITLIVVLLGAGGGGYAYLDAAKPPPPLAAPGGAAKPRPPRIEDPSYPLGMKAPKSVRRAAAEAKPLPPPVDEGVDAAAAVAADSAKGDEIGRAHV